MNVNLLYLGSAVLILQELSYMSRFWVYDIRVLYDHDTGSLCAPHVLNPSLWQTLFEAWCAFQKTRGDGLCAAPPNERRATIICIHQARIATHYFTSLPNHHARDHPHRAGGLVHPRANTHRWSHPARRTTQARGTGLDVELVNMWSAKSVEEAFEVLALASHPRPMPHPCWSPAELVPSPLGPAGGGRQVLASPDVVVTNQSDKEMCLPKLLQVGALE